MGAAAHIRAIEIQLQDLALGEPRFEPERQKHFLDLARDRAFGRQEEVLGELLRERGAALDDGVGADVFDKRAEGAEEVDTDMLEEPPVLRGERRLDHVVGDFLDRDGVVDIDAALADDVAVAILEGDGEVIEREPVLAVDFLECGQREDVEDDEAAGAEGQAFGGEFVRDPGPAVQPETRKEARSRHVAALDPLPRLREAGIDPGIEPKPVDQSVASALSKKPIAQSTCLPRRGFPLTAVASPIDFG